MHRSKRGSVDLRDADVTVKYLGTSERAQQSEPRDSEQQTAPTKGVAHEELVLSRDHLLDHDTARSVRLELTQR